jgi:taurine transport system substrate-binding protein
VAENGDFLAKFLKVTADANAMWNSGENTEEMLPVIAKDAGMDLEATRAFIATMEFPSVEEQLSAKWLGGSAQNFMLGVAKVFKDAGSIPAARDSYEDAVNTGPLAAAQGM